VRSARQCLIGHTACWACISHTWMAQRALANPKRGCSLPPLHNGRLLWPPSRVSRPRGADSDSRLAPASYRIRAITQCSRPLCDRTTSRRHRGQTKMGHKVRHRDKYRRGRRGEHRKVKHNRHRLVNLRRMPSLTMHKSGRGLEISSSLTRDCCQNGILLNASGA
jgi:hypothetical protein